MRDAKARFIAISEWRCSSGHSEQRTYGAGAFLLSRTQRLHAGLTSAAPTALRGWAKLRLFGNGEDRVEAVGFVAGRDFSFAQADDCKTFGGAEAGAAPPISADGAAGDVLRIFVLDDFVYVGVALEDG